MWSCVDRVVVVIVGGFAGFRNLHTGTTTTILCASRLVSTAFYTVRPPSGEPDVVVLIDSRDRLELS